MNSSGFFSNNKKVILSSCAIVLSVLLLCGSFVMFQLSKVKDNSDNDITSSENSLVQETSSMIQSSEVSDESETSSDEASSEEASSEEVSSQTVSSRPVNKVEGMVCYLTFDDGPSSNITTRILDTLKEYDVKATFFVVGTSNLNLLPRIQSEGHAIGIHSNTHYWSVYDSVDNYFNDINALSDKINSKCGFRPDILRFIGGSSNSVSKKHCAGIMTTLTKEVENRGYYYFDWNVDSLDASNKKYTKEQIAQNVLSGARDSKGNPRKEICVLMHDISGKDSTADALPEIITGLKEMGYRFEVLSSKAPEFHHNVYN